MFDIFTTKFEKDYHFVRNFAYAISVKQEGSDIRIPLAYGPTQKFLARIEQSPDPNKPMAITLPRMSLSLLG